MRINVYAEELTDDITVVKTHAVNQDRTAFTGKTFSGIRFYLESSDKLHNSPEDDDRSAVTFWGPRERLKSMFLKAASEL